MLYLDGAEQPLIRTLHTGYHCVQVLIHAPGLVGLSEEGRYAGYMNHQWKPMLGNGG